MDRTTWMYFGVAALAFGGAFFLHRRALARRTGRELLKGERVGGLSKADALELHNAAVRKAKRVI